MKTRFLSFITIISLGAFISCSKYIDTRTGTSTTSTSSGSTSSSSGSTGSSGSSGSNSPAPTPGTGGSTGTTGGTTSGSPAPTPITNPTTGSGSGTSTTIVSNVDFTITSTSPCSPSIEKFTFTSLAKNVPTGSIYQWYFGDGTSQIGTSSTATVSYNSFGTRTVIMKIVNNNAILGERDTVITSYGQDVTPTANFYSQGPDNNNLVSFNSTTSLNHGSISTYNWNFGDGNIANANSFTTHTYAVLPTDKTYNVILTATANSGCAGVRTIPIIIPAVYTFTGDFSWTSTSPCGPTQETITFTSTVATTAGVAIPSPSYAWDFGDGTTGSGATVTKQYSSSNNYSVILTVYSNGKQVYKTQNKSVKAWGPDVTPKASFQVYQKDNTKTYWGFNSTATLNHGAFTSFVWDYGDGSAKDSGIQYAEHVYQQQTTDKSYTVSLTVTADSGCSDTYTYVVTVPHK